MDEKCLVLFFHSCLNCGSIPWCSTCMAKVKKLYSKQKQAINIYGHTAPILRPK